MRASALSLASESWVVESAAAAAMDAGASTEDVPPRLRDTPYPMAMMVAITAPITMAPRVTWPRRGAEDIRQFGQTPMATGRCTPQLGQLSVGTRSAPLSYDTNGTWQRGQRVAPTNALAPHDAQFVYGTRPT
jgi:hypothetical protein